MAKGELDLVKVIFVDEDGGTESLWAERVAPTLGRVDNSPFFIYGISYGDLVTMKADPDHEDIYHFEAVYEKSGNRTIRIYSGHAAITDPVLTKVWDRIAAAGGSYEGFPPKLVSVNIPPEVDIDAITAIVDNADLEWEHGDLGLA